LTLEDCVAIISAGKFGNKWGKIEGWKVETLKSWKVKDGVEKPDKKVKKAAVKKPAAKKVAVKKAKK
jgi:hypothetical protein